MLDNDLPNTENSTQNTEPSAAPCHKTATKAAKSGERRTDKIFKFFSKAGIKKFVLILYCVVPLLIVSIGFAAWIITGNNASGTTGQFTAYGIINSYDYIALKPDTDIGAIDFYATGFYKDGKIVNTVSFDIEYTINLSQCAYHLKTDTPNNGYLTADFELFFNSGNGDINAGQFFKNLNCAINVATVNDNTTTIIDTLNYYCESESESDYCEIESESALNLLNDTAWTITLSDSTSSKNNHHVFIKINTNKLPDKVTKPTDENNNLKKIKLTFTYTLDYKELDYKELYQLISSISTEKLAVDVKITD